jgi:CubicO group peptidase (beta-lactamase class C family)
MKLSSLKWWHWLLTLIILLNVVMWSTGKLYLYKALVYNFVNIDDLDLFPSREVSAGNPQPWNVASAYNQTPLSGELRAALEEYETVAFLVIKDDSIKYEEYWDGYTDSSLSNSFSMAKSIVSILIGIALDEGKIKSLDQPVCDFVPEYCHESNNKLTVRHLLMMSSGLNYDEGYASLFGPTTRSYYDTDLRKQINELQVVTDPGKEFNYMSCNTQLLAFIVEAATGKNISEYASEKLWKPVGAEHDARWSLDRKDGDEKAYCCFYSNARDFARIGKLFLQNGRWNNTQVVSENFVRESVSPAPISDKGKPNAIYGYQWWLMNFEGHDIFYARGILGQYIIVIPDQNIIFVRLGHKRGEKDADGQLLDLPVYIREVISLFGKSVAS